MSRREFLAKSALVAAAAAIVVGCGNGQIGPTAVTIPGSNGSSGGNTGTGFKVSNYAGLATVGTLVQVDSYRAVKRTGSTTFAAFSMVCTHQGCLTVLQSNAFSCPCHGAVFNNNGQVTRGPANSPLTQYTTSYNPTTDLLTIG